MNKKNILHVITVSFSIPIFFRNQFKYFENRQNTYLACKDSIQFRDLSLLYPFVPIKLNIERKISPLKDLFCLFELYHQIKKNNIEIVVGHTPKAALLAMIASYFAKIKKRIYFKHGLVFETQTGLNKYLMIIIEKITEYFSTEIICVSDSLIKTSITYKLGNPKKYILLNKGTCNGIDSDSIFNPDLYHSDFKNELRKKLNIPINGIVVGFVGRLANDKGINELLKAWELIDRKYNNIHLLLVGPSDERDPFIFNFSCLSKNIIRVDYISDPTPFYAILNLFILPSFREGFPTVNLEASSMKLPVITTKNTGCIDSIIDSVTGIYTDINPQSISNSIEYYITNPELLKVHGENGRKFVINNFNQIVVWESLSKIYFT